MEHDLPGVLDGADEPVTVEALEAVVRRASQRRRATLVAAAAALLVLGGWVGALVGGGRRAQSSGVSADRPAPNATSLMAAGGASALPPGVGPVQLTPLFHREANGITVRAYDVRTPETSQPADPACRIPPHFVQAELSTDQAVGVAIGPLLPKPNTAAVANLPPYDLAISDAGTFGIGEGAPVTWAILEGVSGLAAVRLRVGNAIDTMVPQDDKVVLAAPGAGAGVVEVLDTNGGVAHSQPLVTPDVLASRAACSSACRPAVPWLDPTGPAGAPPPGTSPAACPTATAGIAATPGEVDVHVPDPTKGPGIGIQGPQRPPPNTGPATFPAGVPAAPATSTAASSGSSTTTTGAAPSTTSSVPAP